MALAPTANRMCPPGHEFESHTLRAKGVYIQTKAWYSILISNNASRCGVMVATLVLGTSAFGRRGSTPLIGTRVSRRLSLSIELA